MPRTYIRKTEPGTERKLFILSFAVGKSTDAKLKDRAYYLRTTKSELVRRYINEGLERDDAEHKPGIVGGFINGEPV